MVPAKHTVDGMSQKIFDERRKSFTGGGGRVPLPTSPSISVASPLHARRNSAAAVDSSQVVAIQGQKAADQQAAAVVSSEIAMGEEVQPVVAVEVSAEAAAVESKPVSWDFGRFFRCFSASKNQGEQKSTIEMPFK